MNFRRRVLIEIAAGPGEPFRGIEGLDVTFAARQSGTTGADDARVTVVGQSAQSLSVIRTPGAIVRVSASYGDAEPVPVCQGAVVPGSLRDEPQDDGLRRIEVQVGDGIDVRRLVVSVERSQPSTGEDVAREVARLAGIPVGVIRTGREVTYRGGYARVATVAQHLDDLAADLGCSWSVQDGRLSLWPADGQREVRDIAVSADTGLIGHPIAQDGAVVFLMQLIPGLRPGDVLTAQTREYRGRYIVREVQHVGGSRSENFETRATCTLEDAAPTSTDAEQAAPRVSEPRLTDALQATRRGAAADVETVLVAEVERYDAAQQTVDVRQVVAPRFESGGVVTFADPVALTAVPVRWERSGARGLTFGLDVGDRGYLVVRSRSHDEVDDGETASTVRPVSQRRHALRDAYFVPGYQPRGGLTSSDYRSDGQVVLTMPSGEALHLGTATALELIARADLVLAELQAIETTLTTGSTPTGGGTVTFATAYIAPTSASAIASDRVKVDS